MFSLWWFLGRTGRYGMKLVKLTGKTDKINIHVNISNPGGKPTKNVANVITFEM